MPDLPDNMMREEVQMLDSVSGWVGRKVVIIDGVDGTIGEVGTVIAVDDTPWRPAAWVRVHEDSGHPSYRSCDLCWLQDVASGEHGMAWGTGGPQADVSRMRSLLDDK